MMYKTCDTSSATLLPERPIRSFVIIDLGLPSPSMFPRPRMGRAERESFKKLLAMSSNSLSNRVEQRKFSYWSYEPPQYFVWDFTWCPVPTESHATPGTFLWILREHHKLNTGVHAVPSPPLKKSLKCKRHAFSRINSHRIPYGGNPGWMV